MSVSRVCLSDTSVCVGVMCVCVCDRSTCVGVVCVCDMSACVCVTRVYVSDTSACVSVTHVCVCVRVTQACWCHTGASTRGPCADGEWSRHVLLEAALLPQGRGTGRSRRRCHELAPKNTSRGLGGVGKSLWHIPACGEGLWGYLGVPEPPARMWLGGWVLWKCRVPGLGCHAVLVHRQGHHSDFRGVWKCFDRQWWAEGGESPPRVRSGGR